MYVSIKRETVHVMLHCRTLHGLRRNCMLHLFFRHGAHVNLNSYTDLPGTDAELLDLARYRPSVGRTPDKIDVPVTIFSIPCG
ncbi:hypothetical protein NC652_010260 [Populus alba x Populus x berolinensis]|nr:hypothetical protein NC652_010260 [Populus alba x Populus x berolinensis]